MGSIHVLLDVSVEQFADVVDALTETRRILDGYTHMRHVTAAEGQLYACRVRSLDLVLAQLADAQVLVGDGGPDGTCRHKVV